MSDIQKILALAREQLGTAESPPGSNDVIYNTVYYGGEVQGSSYPWCCAFIWWLFRECGLSALFCGGQKTAYCPFVVQYARDNGKWRTEGYRPGDLLLYDWNGDGVADHIGLCESDTDEAGYLWAIEGNCGDAVARVRRWTGSILGAYRPAYTDEEDGPSGRDALSECAGGAFAAKAGSDLQSRPGSPAPTDDAGDEADSYTVRPGDMLGRIAARFGTTVAELVKLNDITDPNRIYPGQVLKLRETEETVSVTLTLPKSVFARYGSASRIEEVLAG